MLTRVKSEVKIEKMVRLISFPLCVMVSLDWKILSKNIILIHVFTTVFESGNNLKIIAHDEVFKESAGRNECVCYWRSATVVTLRPHFSVSQTLILCQSYKTQNYKKWLSSNKLDCLKTSIILLCVTDALAYEGKITKKDFIIL